MRGMIMGIKSFKALITRKELISDEIDFWVKAKVNEKGFDLIFSVQAKDNNLDIFVKEGKVEGELESLLMFSKGLYTVFPETKTEHDNLGTLVLMIEGKIELTKIAQLISIMNLPGGDQLKKLVIYPNNH